MKRYFIIIPVLLILNSMLLHSQTLLSLREPSVRHSKGMMNINVNYYWDKYGYSTSIGYNYNIKNRQMFEVNLAYGKGKIKLSDYKDYDINASYKYSLIKIHSRFFTNVGAGMYFEYEIVDNYEFQLERDYTMLGVMGYLEEEIYLFNGFYFTGRITQYYNPKTYGKYSSLNSPYEKFNYGIGLKYEIN